MPPVLQAAVRGYMSREHQMLTWHTLEGDLEAKQKALAEMDKSKVRAAAYSMLVSCSGPVLACRDRPRLAPAAAELCLHAVAVLVLSACMHGAALLHLMCF